MSKLKEGMNGQEIVVAMAEGNIGAVVAMAEIRGTSQGSVILQLLDTYKIYGTDLYVLYNDKCMRLPRRLHTLLLGTQLKIIHPEELVKMAKDQNNDPLLSFSEAMVEKFGNIIQATHFEGEACDK